MSLYILSYQLYTPSNMQALMNVGEFIVQQGLNVGIIVGPLFGFVAQYKLIKTNKSVGSFSTDVCAILLFANILRIFFWFEKRFEVSLLIQSILMIIMQIQLLRLCLSIHQKTTLQKQKIITIKENPLANFWRWTSIDSYLASLVGFIIVIFGMCIWFSNLPLFWEMIGFASCSIEATLGFPQAMKNHTSKNIAGLSYAMIMAWFLGDAFKTFYFILLSQPMQFVMCGVVQLTVDTIILVQIGMYKNKTLMEI